MKVGITGHQELGNILLVRWIKNRIKSELDLINIQVGYSCLAKGADQLFGQILFENKTDLVAIIPCKKYSETFRDTKYLEKYNFLRKYAVKEINLPYDHPTEEAFFSGGKEVVYNCDILFAVWNGLPAKGLGGTADVVNYAQQNHKPIIHINPINKTIKQIEHGKH